MSHINDKLAVVKVFARKFGIVVRWFFGVGFVLLGAGYLSSHIVAAISSLLLASLLIPPVEKLLFSKIKMNAPLWSKVLLGVFLVGVTGANSPKVENKMDDSKQVESVVEVEISEKEEGSQSAPTMQLNEVVKVIDGDTIQVKIDDKAEVIRLIGIDTPESVDSRKPVQCFASEATKKIKILLPVGSKVSLEIDSTQGEKDKYNRLLRYVFLENGTDVGKLLIQDGYAHEYTYKLPYKYMDDYKEVEKLAREEKRGLWADEACVVQVTPSTKVVTPTTTNTIVPIANPTMTKNTPPAGSYSCGTKTKCGEMTTCAEAMYYLNTCGVSRLDADKDGVPCETLCN